jgi:hypothetical protein
VETCNIARDRGHLSLPIELKSSFNRDWSELIPHAVLLLALTPETPPTRRLTPLNSGYRPDSEVSETQFPDGKGAAHLGQAARSFAQVASSASGNTRVSAVTVMKLVSPTHRGKACMCI